MSSQLLAFGHTIKLYAKNPEILIYTSQVPHVKEIQLTQLYLFVSMQHLHNFWRKLFTTDLLYRKNNQRYKKDNR